MKNNLLGLGVWVIIGWYAYNHFPVAQKLAALVGQFLYLTFKI